MSGSGEDVPVWQRETLGRDQQLTGPAIVTEATSTTWIGEGWQARMDASGNLHLWRA